MIYRIAKTLRPFPITWVSLPASLRVRRGPTTPLAYMAATIAHLQKAVVKSLPEDSTLTISLTLGGRQRNLERPKDEALEKPLQRLQKAAVGKPDKKQKQQKQGDDGVDMAPPAVFVGLHDGPTPDHPLLDPKTTLNAAAWLTGRLLRVGDAQFAVELNPPSIATIDLHGAAFVDIPLVPRARYHFAEGATWRWLKRSAYSNDEWQVIPGAEDRRYVPGPQDQGLMLKVECTPVRGDLVGAPAITEVGPVRAPPHPAAGQGRHEYTAQRTTSPDVRVVTYNVLADQYASTDTAREVLFSYCPPEYLDPLHRRPLVLSELLGYNADIICLQEVDDKAFNLHLQPNLDAAGYDGVYTNKAGKVREGSATFWRRDRFQLAHHTDLPLRSVFPDQSGASAKHGSTFADMLNTSPALMHALQRVATVAQLTLLEPVGADSSSTLERPLCVANTHLFFHYAAPHIRTMHVWTILQEAKEFMSAWQAEAGANVAPSPALLFCGDFNSDLNDGIPGAIELLQAGSVPKDHWDWAFGVDFSWGKAARGADEGGEGEEGEGEPAPGPGPANPSASTDSDVGEVSKMMHTEIEHMHPRNPTSPAEIVPGVHLTSPFTLASADALTSDFTNYVKGYQGLLDYVWYDTQAMEVVQVVPLPSLQQLGGYLPSKNYPSDHIAVVTDLRFSSGAGGASGSGASEQHQGGAPTGSSDGNGSGSGPKGPNVLPAALYNVGLAASQLTAGDVIAVPTDTIYGLAASASSSSGVDRIYDIKQRSAHKPLAVCVADLEDVGRYGEVAHLSEALLQDLLPGPVTLLLTKRVDAPLAPELNPGTAVIGIRIPDHLFLRAVCRQHKGALALTSANISGGQSSVDIDEFQPLWSECKAVYDGGKLPAGRTGSTIIDLTVAGQFKIARRGNGFAECMQKLQNKYGLTHIL